MKKYSLFLLNLGVMILAFVFASFVVADQAVS